MTAAIVLAVLAFVLFIVVASSVRIVRPYQRGVVERLGRYRSTADPGLRLIIPFVDRIRLVDMREQVVDVPPQEVITADNVVVSVDAVVYHEPTDPQRLIYNVADFMLAVTKLAQTNLRNLVGDLQLDQALTSRDSINASLREILDDATDTWGAILIVATLVAGIYGMNFRYMPELDWHYGYFFALGTMLASTGGLYLYFKRKSWL